MSLPSVAAKESDPAEESSIEFEEGLFGACIYEPHLFEQFGRIGKKFSEYPLGLAYNRLFDAHAAGKRVDDALTVLTELRPGDLIGKLRGEARLYRILSDTPSSAHAAYYCEEIARTDERKRWRKLAKTITEQVDRGKTDLLAELVRDQSEKITSRESAAATITMPSLAILHEVMGRLQRGEGDVVFDAGPVFPDFEVGPGLLAFLAAGPGAGKTTMAMQFGFSVLKRHPELRLIVCNAETGFDRLLKRELTRLSGVPSRALRFADLTARQLDAVEQAAATLEPLLSRVDVLEGPYGLDRIQQLRSVTPGLLILDYLQKFLPADKDARNGATAVAAELRNLCHMGWAVLCLSATSRTQTKGNSGHDSSQLNMASLKESGEIEFNADAVYVIRDKGETDQKHVRKCELDAVKSRHDCKGHVPLIFDMPRSEFRLPDPIPGDGGDFEEWDAGSAEDDPFGGPA